MYKILKINKMKTLSLLLITCLFLSCESKQDDMTKAIFLHHSTGKRIWLGSTHRYVYKITKRGDVESYFKKYNKKNNVSYIIKEQAFPAESPYGWRNNVYDYYNIWVKNAGEKSYKNEPTLEILTKENDVIIFKHCFPLTKIKEDTGIPNIDSEVRSIENYKLQYTALKKKMHEFPGKKFIVWTPAVHVKNNLSHEEAQRTNNFYKWVIDEWDEKGDNIFVFDFYQYETEGGLYLLDKYASGPKDSHPNRQLSGRIAPLFAQFVIDVIEGKIK
jgi:hypothetical protein